MYELLQERLSAIYIREAWIKGSHLLEDQPPHQGQKASQEMKFSPMSFGTWDLLPADKTPTCYSLVQLGSQRYGTSCGKFSKGDKNGISAIYTEQRTIPSPPLLSSRISFRVGFQNMRLYDCSRMDKPHLRRCHPSQPELEASIPIIESVLNPSPVCEGDM